MVFIEGLRLLFVFIGLIIGDQIANHLGLGSLDKYLSSSVGVLLGYVIGGVLGRFFDRGIYQASKKSRELPAAEVLGASVMGTTGIVIAIVIGVPIFIFLKPVVAVAIVGVVVWILAYFGIRIGIAKASQITRSVGITRRVTEDTEDELLKGSVMMDVSSAMERSIWVLGKLGLIAPEIIVPRIVIDELEHLASSSDQTTSRKARRGLDVIEALQTGDTNIVVAEESVPESDHLDEKILILADRLKVKVLSSSSSLIERAANKNITVVDLRNIISDLAPDHIAGEILKIELLKGGSQDGQAVGFLPDGDMVVVNDASHMIGKGDVTVEVINSRRTSQGLLVFAKLNTQS